LAYFTFAPDFVDAQPVGRSECNHLQHCHAESNPSGAAGVIQFEQTAGYIFTNTKYA
jgi:hypothetical protein